MLTPGQSVNHVAASPTARLDAQGLDLEVRTESRALYEVTFRLVADRQEARNAALVQFLTDDGNLIDAPYVSPSFSAKVGRFMYLSADPETGIGRVKFFAPESLSSLRLRFRAWANRKPIFIGQAIRVKRLSGWAIDSASDQTIRLISEPRPIQQQIPPGGVGTFRLDASNAEQAAAIVVQASCQMSLIDGTLRLEGEEGGEGEEVRPFAHAEEARELALHIKNERSVPTTLWMSCSGVPKVDVLSRFELEDGDGRSIAPSLILSDEASSPSTDRAAIVLEAGAATEILVPERLADMKGALRFHMHGEDLAGTKAQLEFISKTSGALSRSIDFIEHGKALHADITLKAGIGTWCFRLNIQADSERAVSVSPKIVVSRTAPDLPQQIIAREETGRGEPVRKLDFSRTGTYVLLNPSVG